MARRVLAAYPENPQHEHKLDERRWKTAAAGAQASQGAVVQRPR